MTLLDSAAPDPVKNGRDATFANDVIQASQQAPVIVDFWAPWCGPCRQLTPALEKAVRSAGGRVTLVKINIDENPAIAGQLGVRSIPAVFAFDKGRPVDGFMGALPESQIKLFVGRLAGTNSADDAAELLLQAAESLALGDAGGAAQSYAKALQIDPQNAKAIAGLARSYLAAGEPEQARQVIEGVPEDKKSDPDVQGVRAALELAADGGAGDPAALKARLAGAPGDHEARYDLARALAARGDLQGAVDHLLSIVASDRDWSEGAARKHLIKIFDAAGAASELTRSGRRKLSTLLFS
jgi:putative thioredoxin